MKARTVVVVNGFNEVLGSVVVVHFIFNVVSYVEPPTTSHARVIDNDTVIDVDVVGS